MAENNTPKSTNLFYLRLEEWNEIKTALRLLQDAKADLLKINDSQIARFFEYADQLYTVSQIYNDKNIFETIDISTMRFLQPAVIKAFIKDPTNLVWSSVVFQQFAMVSAATLNSRVEELKEYDLEEILHIINGTADVYSPFTFVFTLRSLIEKDEFEERIAAIFLLLDKIDPENFEFPEYFWQGGLEFSLVMQLLWKNFVFLGSAQQEFLLQNYFYTAIVAGVPVEYWLSQILSLTMDAIDTEAANNFFLRSLEKSNEVFPINTASLAKRKVTDLLLEYVGNVYGSEIKTLAQEKFIDNIYKGQLEDKKFSQWLRTLLQIYYNLRTKTYLHKF